MSFKLHSPSLTQTFCSFVVSKVELRYSNYYYYYYCSYRPSSFCHSSVQLVDYPFKTNQQQFKA